MTDQDSQPPTQSNELEQLEEQYENGLISRQVYYQRKRFLISGVSQQGMSEVAKIAIVFLITAAVLFIFVAIFMDALVCADSGQC